MKRLTIISIVGCALAFLALPLQAQDDTSTETADFSVNQIFEVIVTDPIIGTLSPFNNGGDSASDTQSITIRNNTGDSADLDLISVTDTGANDALQNQLTVDIEATANTISDGAVDGPFSSGGYTVWDGTNGAQNEGQNLVQLGSSAQEATIDVNYTVTAGSEATPAGNYQITLSLEMTAPGTQQ